MYAKVIIKKVLLSLYCIYKKIRNKISFNGKNIKKVDFYKNKKITKTDDIDVNKILVSKKNPTLKRIHLNTLLGIMIMMSLNHCV